MPSHFADDRRAAAKACVGRSLRSASSVRRCTPSVAAGCAGSCLQRNAFTSRTASSSARTSRTKSGFRSRSAPPRRDLDEEQQSHRDLLWLNVTEGLVTGCIEKSFGWWAHATRAHPSAAFIAKTDDDAFVDLPSLVRLLRAVRAEPGSPLVYGGWLQWTSWFERRYFGCGWATSPLDALRERARRATARGANTALSTNAPRPTREPISSPSSGRYPFAVGALEVMSGALAARVFGSPSVRILRARRDARLGDGGARAARPEVGRRALAAAAEQRRARRRRAFASGSASRRAGTAARRTRASG